MSPLLRRTCHKLTQRSKLTRIIFSFVFCKKKRSFFYAKSECCHFMSCLEHVHPSLTWPLLLENSKNANLVKKKYNPSSSKNSTHPLLICHISDMLGRQKLGLDFEKKISELCQVNF